MFHNYRLVYAHLLATYGREWQVALAFGLRLVSLVGRLVGLPVALSLIIARLSVGDFGGAQAAVWLFAGVSLAIGVLSPITRYVGVLGESKAYRKITIAYFGRLINADLDYFHSNLAGYLTTATRQYTDSCMRMVRATRERYLATTLSILFPMAVILWLDVWLGLVAFMLSLVQAAYLLWASRVVDPYRTKARELYKSNSGRMADIVSNILAVKASATESEYLNRVRIGASQENEVFRRRFAVQSKLITFREVITVAFFLTLLWLAVQRMGAGAIEIAGAVLVVTYTTTIMAAIYGLSEDLDEHDDLVDKIIPAFEILNRQNLIADPAEPRKLHHARGDIELQNVTFAYREKPAQPVLKDFSLHIPHGQKLGVVGLSGAGKSTLTKLLMRFDDVHSGRILVDGKDVRGVRQADLRSHMAYVPQEPLLFHTSIRDNIMLAHPNATQKEVEQALRKAHAWEFIRDLPDGIDSIVGERGVKLSGGQKQRIAIARAVLQKAPIMILDEATSALDSESEQIIKSSFSQILRGRTAFVVAHRLSTLSEMNRIIVIDNGKLVEDGTHDQLIANNGLYAKLWHRQQRLTDQAWVAANVA